MTRLILAIFLALSFIVSAPVSVAAPFAGTPANGCSMPGEIPDQPADHGKMDCCTHDCAMFAAVGLLPSGEPEDRAGAEQSAPAVLSSADELDSLSPAAVDPPPRLHLS